MVQTRSQTKLLHTLMSIKTPRISKISKRRSIQCKYGTDCYRTNILHITKYHKDLRSMPLHMICPCGGGQSCLIDRRWVGDWCHEDDVFKNADIPLRTSCIEPYTMEQETALTNDIHNETVFWDNSQLWNK
jgi:hypothetical protein